MYMLPPLLGAKSMDLSMEFNAMKNSKFISDPRFSGIERFEHKVWLSSVGMFTIRWDARIHRRSRKSLYRKQLPKM